MKFGIDALADMSATGQKLTTKIESPAYRGRLLETIDCEVSLAIDQLLWQRQSQQRAEYRKTGDEVHAVVCAAGHILDPTHHIGAD